MNEQVLTVGKVGGSVLSPFGKINLYITLGVLLFLVIFSSIQAVRQHDIYPLLDNVLFRIVGADHVLSQDLDALDPILTHGQPRILSSEWFSYWWHIILLWLNVIVTLWFIFVVIYWLYKLFYGLNNTNPLMNVFYAIVLFAILQVIVGLALYPTLMAGKVMSDDKISILNDAFSHSYPFEGVIKLFSRLLSGSLLDSTYAFINTPTVQVIAGIPNNTSGVGI